MYACFLDSIENAIESAYGAVEDGHSELEKAAIYQVKIFLSIIIMYYVVKECLTMSMFKV